MNFYLTPMRLCKSQTRLQQHQLLHKTTNAPFTTTTFLCAGATQPRDTSAPSDDRLNHVRGLDDHNDEESATVAAAQQQQQQQQ